MPLDLKENQVLLFQNDKRLTDKHPTHKGEALISGKQYWASGWIRETRNGGQMVSISLSSKEENIKKASEIKNSVATPKPEHDNFGDLEIPF